MYYQYEFAHFKGNMGHGVASDALAHGALPAGATLLGWPNYGVDGRLKVGLSREHEAVNKL
jgi:hypothetical protein